MHRIDIPEWAIERGRLTQYFSTIVPSRTALLAIDLQRAFTASGTVFGNPHACDILPTVNGLAEGLRQAGGKVVWTRQTISDEVNKAMPDWHYDMSSEVVLAARASLRSGTRDHALHSQCDVRECDWVIDKYRYSVFARHASDLDGRLQRAGIDTLIVTGTLTNACCESTARDASQMGYKVFFASDATAARTDEEHNAALLNLTLMFADVRPAESLLALLAQQLPSNALDQPASDLRRHKVRAVNA